MRMNRDSGVKKHGKKISMETISEVSRLCSLTSSLQRKLELEFSTPTHLAKNGYTLDKEWYFFGNFGSKALENQSVGLSKNGIDLKWAWNLGLIEGKALVLFDLKTKFSFYENWLSSTLNDPIQFQFC